MPRVPRRLSSSALAIATLSVAAAALAAPAAADINAVPGPPTEVAARAGDRLAEVTWSAPAPDDPSITSYTVTASPADVPPVTVDPTARTATVTGLTNGTSYTFTVAAANADGTGPTSQPSAPVTPAPPAATTLTFAATPTRVLYGGGVTLSGRLQLAATQVGIAGETVTVDQRPKGRTGWTALVTVTTAADGTLDPIPPVIPQAHTDYRLRHATTPFYAASVSPIAAVLVGVRLTAGLDPTSIALGRAATIDGQVVPAHTRQRVLLQQWQGRSWRTVQASTLAASGRYRFTLRPRTTGATRWRVCKPKDADHLGAISASVRLVAYRAAIVAIHADATGDDRRNLNGEYVLVRNLGRAAVNLAGWKVDAGDPGQRSPLAAYPLRPGAVVRIHTGQGATTPGHLYLGSGRPIWNNHGDVGTLIDPHNVSVSRYRY